MSAEALLSRLQRVRRTGSGRWVASSPTREDKHPSLTIRELPDGRVLIHDFGGASVQEILDAVGLEFDALYPERAPDDHRRPRERRPFPVLDILEVMAHEAMIAAIAASDLSQGKTLAEADRTRLMVAAQRLLEAHEVALGRG